MRAAVTKIPHLLYEEGLLKTQKWCMILFTIYHLFTVDMMGMGEKNPKNIYMKKQGKNSLFGCPPIPRSMKLEADCFPGRTGNKPDLP